jgi:hypothetical protein
MSLRPHLSILSLLAAAAISTARADTAAGLAAITAGSAHHSVEVLASDAFEGRGSGAPGGRRAGDWLAEQLRAIGVAPAGTDGYFQPFRAQDEDLRNVLATIPGREPGEAIVIGAHYDHLGLGEQQGALDFVNGRGKVHNGADDNASGTAAVLEIARAFVAAGQTPRRRVIFCLFDGEERGLLGSAYYVEHPAFPDKVDLMINLDMVGRLHSALTVYGVNTGDELAGWLQQANEGVGLTFSVRKALAPNSDHESFYKAGIPVLAPFTGLHADYHRATDDVEKVNAEGIAQVARLCFGVAERACEADRPPVFAKAPDGSGEAILEELQAMLGADRFADELARLRERLHVGPDDLATLSERLRRFLDGADRPRLGVTLDEEAGGPGLLLRSVTPGSLAERAGLRAGDRLVRFGKDEVEDVEALRYLVKTAEGEVALEVEHEGGAREVIVVDFGGGAPRPAPARPSRPPADGKRWY